MAKYNIKKITLFVFGWIFVGLGVIGVVVPLMPTTPFLLVSLLCFSHSSDRFHHWLFNHKILGKPLRDWQETRRIPTYAKVLMAIMIPLSCGIFLFHLS